MDGGGASSDAVRQARSNFEARASVLLNAGCANGGGGSIEAGENRDTSSRALPIWRMHSRWQSMEHRSAEYHRAAAARARRLLAEATTPWVKQQLAEAIERHDHIAAEIERASKPDPNAVSLHSEAGVLSNEASGRGSVASAKPLSGRSISAPFAQQPGTPEPPGTPPQPPLDPTAPPPDEEPPRPIPIPRPDEPPVLDDPPPRRNSAGN